MTNQKINIDGIEYEIVDSIQDLRAEDSFIHRNNKLQMFGWNWEARKYVGSYKWDKWDALKNFFEYGKWGECKDENWSRIYEIISKNCFFSKNNLLKYMEDARIEYFKQEQIYHNNIANFFDEYNENIKRLENEINYFSIYDVSDFIETGRWRGYIRSDDKIWDIWRRIILPKISYLSILKIKPVDKNFWEEFSFYFRILLDYNFRSIVHPKILKSEEEKISEREIDVMVNETQRKKIREWQQKYRKWVIEYMPQCPFTLISDERLLIASHIKPYKSCIEEWKIDEAIDYLNWLSLTPTYDKLFDQGYITFTDEWELICGTLLSSYTWDKLNINPTVKKKFRIFPENREKYLDFHRKYVFRDNIEEFI